MLQMRYNCRRNRAATLEPALGPRFEGGDVLGRKVQPHNLPQKGCRFLGGKTQIGGAQSQLLLADTQARERKRGINARSKDHMHLLWQVIEQEGKSLMDGGGGEHMVVIEHKDEMPSNS